MWKQLRANLLLIGMSFVLCAVAYPLAVLATAGALFPTSAAGSLVVGPDGKPTGSRLIAQEFKGDEWFQPRPSAVGFNAAGSGGSNFGANNPKLRERVTDVLKSRGEKSGVPSDAVTASGSGLDPHITLKNAEGQLDRVVTTWATKSGSDTTQVRGTIEALLKEAAFEPLAGLAGGQQLVNVFEVNAELARRFGKERK